MLGQTAEENIRARERVQGNGENYIVHILYSPNIAMIIESRMRVWYPLVTNRNPKCRNLQIEGNALDTGIDGRISLKLLLH